MNGVSAEQASQSHSSTELLGETLAEHLLARQVVIYLARHELSLEILNGCIQESADLAEALGVTLSDKERLY